MELILRQPITGLGRRGDHVKVADGYARNYLLPKGLALVATPKVAQQAESMRKASAEKHQRELEAASELASQLVALEISVAKRSSRDGKLFGSVTTGEIAEKVTELSGVTIDRHQVNMSEPIKTTGTFSVPIRLHPEVEVAINVEVIAES
ncbi:MAG: 50S ribosomal protein L9 [Ferrimicrobium sp.]|uniref:50S ribosomal protein L9 n=1 Tax=Ferrimicrobium sp. TaxID=2926050 RepID=UPI00262ED648|nr:50S ribosomal protein L9 [Ferrimicrobium sp.]